MLARFGGVTGFTKIWLAYWDHISQPRQLRHSSLGVTRCFDTFFKLAEYVETHRRSATGTAILSDDDLAKTLQEQLRLIIRKTPEVAVEALAASGWTLTAPKQQKQIDSLD